jgi:hypothetical protein
MTADDARAWVIKASLGAATGVFLVIMLAPGLPFDEEEGDRRRLLEILMPVWTGYLASASHFVFARSHQKRSRKVSSNAALLIKAPIVAWSVMCAGAFLRFWHSHSRWAVEGAGMSVDELAGVLAGTLSLLAATTGLAVGYLFSLDSASTAGLQKPVSNAVDP